MDFPKETGFDFVGSDFGATFSSSWLSTKLPLLARPGPPLGNRSSPSTSSRIAVMRRRSAPAVTVYTVEAIGPVARIDRSSCLVNVILLVALSDRGLRRTQST